MSDEQTITDGGDLRRYYAAIPHMADDDLDLYEYRLYGHYKRVCGEQGGRCTESTRTTAAKTGMSHPMVIKARRTLVDKGFITTVEEDGQTIKVHINDVWADNMNRYRKPAKEVVTQFTPLVTQFTGGHTVYTKKLLLEDEVKPERPAIFTLYESVLGLMVRSSYEADHLKEIEETYPAAWIEEAFKMAVDRGASKRLPYALSILQTWKDRGKDAPKAPDPKDDPLYRPGRTVYR